MQCSKAWNASEASKTCAPSWGATATEEGLCELDVDCKAPKDRYPRCFPSYEGPCVGEKGNIAQFKILPLSEIKKLKNTDGLLSVVP